MRQKSKLLKGFGVNSQDSRMRPRNIMQNYTERNNYRLHEQRMENIKRREFKYKETSDQKLQRLRALQFKTRQYLQHQQVAQRQKEVILPLWKRMQAVTGCPQFSQYKKSPKSDQSRRSRSSQRYSISNNRPKWLLNEQFRKKEKSRIDQSNKKLFQKLHQISTRTSTRKQKLLKQQEDYIRLRRHLQIGNYEPKGPSRRFKRKRRRKRLKPLSNSEAQINVQTKEQVVTDENKEPNQTKEEVKEGETENKEKLKEVVEVKEEEQVVKEKVYEIGPVKSFAICPLSAKVDDTDYFGKPDPYLVVKVGEVTKKTEEQDSGQNPKWKDVSFTFNDSKETEVQVTVWDDDTFQDDLIGRGVYKLPKTVKKLEQNVILDLWRNDKKIGSATFTFKLLVKTEEN